MLTVGYNSDKETIFCTPVTIAVMNNNINLSVHRARKFAECILILCDALDEEIESDDE